MKKIISLFLIIIMVFSAVGAFAAEDTAPVKNSYDNEFINKYNLLVNLDVFENNGNQTTFSDGVTRLEFAKYLAGLLGVKNQKFTDKVYFNDTTEMYVNNLVEMKIVSGCSDGKFEPDRFITSDEVIVMSMRALGYRDYIETRGGTYEYLAEAKKTGLGFSKDFSGVVTLKDVVELLYVLMNKPVMQVVAIGSAEGSSYVNYSDVKGKSLIEVYRDYCFIKGQMTGNFITSVGDTGTVRKNQVTIDDIVYNCMDPNAFLLIGQRVVAIYNKTSEVIVYIAPDYEKMQVFELQADQIESFDDFTLKYLSENNKEKKIKFDKTRLKVIYNGKAIDSDFKDAFEIGYGVVKLYCLDDTEEFSLAIIEEYVDVTVKMTSTETLKIYTDGEGNMNALDFADANNTGVYKSVFSSESGLSIGLKSVSEGDLLSVCVSRDNEYIVAYLCGKSIIGEITSSEIDNGSLYVTINGESYPVSSYYKGVDLKPGRTGKFVLNKFGYIGRMQQMDSSGTGIGYLYATSIDNGISSDVKVKLYTDTKEHLIYCLANKVMLDGVRVSKSDAYTILTPNGIVSKGLVKYTVNSKGNISAIETGKGDAYFAEMTNGAQTLKYVEQNRAFGQNGEYVMTMGTKVFMVPRGEDTDELENFNIVNYRESMTPAFAREEIVRVYQDNEDPFVEYVLCFYDNRKTSIYGSGSIHMMVEKVVNKITDDGEIITIIKGYNNCMPYEISVTSDVQVLAYAGVYKGIEAIEPGDWIVGTTNASGSISYLLLMYNVDKDEFAPSKPGVHAFHDSQGKVTNANYYDGDILKVERGGADGSEILLVVGNKETGEVRNCVVLDEDLMKFMLYDATGKKSEFSVGNVDDIVSLEMTNGSHCDRIYFEFRSESRLTNIAIYRH